VGREKIVRGDATRVERRAAFVRTNERSGGGMVLWSPSLAISRHLSPSLAVSRRLSCLGSTSLTALGFWLGSAWVVQYPTTSAVTPKTCFFEDLPPQPSPPAGLPGLPPLPPRPASSARAFSLQDTPQCLGARPRASHVLVQAPAARGECEPRALAPPSKLSMLCAQMCDVPNAFFYSFLTRFSSPSHSPYILPTPHTPTHSSPRSRLVAANRTSTSRT
jgi:hypothetical protein